MPETPSRQQALADALYGLGQIAGACAIGADPGVMRQRCEELAVLLCQPVWMGIDWSSDVVAERDRLRAEVRDLVRPRWMVAQDRVTELLEALRRRARPGAVVPVEWIEELQELYEYLNRHNERSRRGG